LRPKGLGLGAERPAADAPSGGGDAKVKGEQQQQLVMKKGTHCVFTASSHKGQYGVVREFFADRTYIYLTPHGLVPRSVACSV
jgi:hypothetical protein